MKKLIFFILLCLAAYYQFIYSAKTTSNNVTSTSDRGKNEPSLFERIKEWVNKNESGGEDLKQLKEELEAKESILAQVEAHIAELKAKPPPSCPRGPATLVITNDPRDQLRKEISILREKIARLEK